MKNRTYLLPFLIFIMFISLIAGAGCGDGDSSKSDPGDDDDISDDDDDDTADDDDDDDDDDTGGDDDDCEKTEHDALMIQGKKALSELDPEGAFSIFESILEDCPDSFDAKAGMIIADAQWLVHWLDNALENPPFDAKSDLTGLQDIFEADILPKSARMMEYADFLAENHPDVRFYVDPLPILYDGEHLLFELSGEWDIYDFDNAKAFARLWEGVGRLLLAFNLEYDQDLFDSNPPPDDATFGEIIHHYCGLLIQLFDDPVYHDFLKFGPDGKLNLTESAVQIGLGLYEIKGNFLDMRNEIDNQEDDVAGYVDLNSNGVWDDGEPFKVPFFGPLSVETNVTLMDLLDLAESLGKSFLDGGPKDINPGSPDWFNIADLNFILEYTDVLDPANPIRLPDFSIPIGQFFYLTGKNGFRPRVEIIVRILYSLTSPAKK